MKKTRSTQKASDLERAAGSNSGRWVAAKQARSGSFTTTLQNKSVDATRPTDLGEVDTRSKPKPRAARPEAATTNIDQIADEVIDNFPVTLDYLAK